MHLIKSLSCGSRYTIKRPRTKISFKKSIFVFLRHLRINNIQLRSTRQRHFLSFFGTIINPRTLFLKHNIFSLCLFINKFLHHLCHLMRLLNLALQKLISWTLLRNELLVEVGVDKVDWLRFYFWSKAWDKFICLRSDGHWSCVSVFIKLS